MVVESRSDLLTPEWGWREMRDYIAASLAQLGLPADPRPAPQLAGIYKAFIARWGAVAAERIVRYAIDVERGVWGGKPIDASRFTKNQDPYFSSVIGQRIIESFEAAR